MSVCQYVGMSIKNRRRRREGGEAYACETLCMIELQNAKLCAERAVQKSLNWKKKNQLLPFTFRFIIDCVRCLTFCGLL